MTSKRTFCTVFPLFFVFNISASPKSAFSPCKIRFQADNFNPFMISFPPFHCQSRQGEDHHRLHCPILHAPERGTMGTVPVVPFFLQVNQTLVRNDGDCPHRSPYRNTIASRCHPDQGCLRPRVRISSAAKVFSYAIRNTDIYTCHLDRSGEISSEDVNLPLKGTPIVKKPYNKMRLSAAF